MQHILEPRRCLWKRKNSTSLLEHMIGWLGCVVSLISLAGCGNGTISGDDVRDCQPFWECEQPLNGNEKDGCGNRRPNPGCNAPSLCGNGVTDPGEGCDWNGNPGCSGSTPVCKPDCSECTGTIEECTEARCTELGKNCGEIVVDSCGAVQCGDCEGPETCGAGGTPNVCGVEDCQANWECEQPLNGNEKDGCGNRRLNPACDTPSPCGNGIKDPGEACDWQGNVGCSGLTPVCKSDCRGCIGESDTLLFDGSFNPTDHRADQNHWIGSYGASYNCCLLHSDSLVVVPAPGTRTGYVGKFTVNPGDICNSPANDRAMVGKAISDGEGAERFYSISTFLPEEFALTSWTMFWEVMPQYYMGPLLALYVEPGSPPYFQFRSGQPETYQNQGLFYDNVGTIQKGKWIDWIVHARWSTSDGFVFLYRRIEPETDYRLIVSHPGIRTLQTRDGTTLPTVDIDLGLYRGPANITTSIFISNVRIGATRASVE